MDASAAMEKMSLRGPGQCLLCKGSCSGYQPHSWRKACMACGCSSADHAPEGDQEDDQRMGRLLGDSPCSHLTAKVKGGGGLRVYKRNRMIVTNPVVSRKDPTFHTTTYDWAPAGLNQKLVRFLQFLTSCWQTGNSPLFFSRITLICLIPDY
uniref:LIM and cysteine-rich domains 1 n=2 Tax=Cyprinodon variegatus TaxID=28743 RepID=A0A3Q2GP30_CYPVA